MTFQVCATLGTTGACSFDNLDEVSFFNYYNYFIFNGQYEYFTFQRLAMFAERLTFGSTSTLPMPVLVSFVQSFACG
jgi:hypothetical protein